jgi:hypothetical protein
MLKILIIPDISNAAPNIIKTAPRIEKIPDIIPKYIEIIPSNKSIILTYIGSVFFNFIVSEYFVQFKPAR